MDHCDEATDKTGGISKYLWGFLNIRKFEISVEHGSLISRESIDNGSWIFNFGILQDIFLSPSNRICSDDSQSFELKNVVR